MPNEHCGHIEIHHRGTQVALHERQIGVRDGRKTLPGHHTVPQHAPREATRAEQWLRGEPEMLQA